MKISEARESAQRMTARELKQVLQADEVVPGISKMRKPQLVEMYVDWLRSDLDQDEPATKPSLGSSLRKHSKSKGEFPPTGEQQSILDLAQEGHPVIMIEAGAGTGKTTTDRMLVDVLPGRGQYTAFNKSLVMDSGEKFRGTRCECNTTHSMAFRAIGKKYSHRLGGNRMRGDQIAKMLGIAPYEVELPQDIEGKPHSKRLAAGFLAAQVLGAIRQFCQSADREVKASHFKYLDGLDLPIDEQRTYDNNDKVKSYLLPFAKKAWADLSSTEGELPFQHDHYVKLWQLSDPVISADYILLDEAQDTAPVMLDILAQQTKQENPPQVILVGDSAQQIYEWRGAVNALAAFPNAPRRFLSQSFRFGQAIADVANIVLEQLSEGTPLRLKGSDKIQSSIVREETEEAPTAILCRTNAVAIANLLGAIENGKKPFLVGGGSQVISFVEAAQSLQAGNGTNHPDLACFTQWGEVQEYAQLDEGEDLKLMVKLIDSFGCQTILDALKGMPQEEDADLVISTAHKSKGREWDRVQLAQDFPTQSQCGDPELKLLYVAVTRAKLVLDVSICPYFTGNDSVDISRVIDDQPHTEPKSLLPPTPSKSPGKFGWRKHEGSWCVSGPVGNEGQTVDVYRRDGSCQSKQLGKVLAEYPDNSIYSV